MLKKTSLMTGFIFLVFLGNALIYILNFSPNNRAIEQIFCTEDSINQPTKISYPNRQEKTGISKDLFIAENEQRLHHSITSPRSLLTANPKGKHIELIEKMFDMKCTLQEKVVDDGLFVRDQIRLVESKEGSYSYTDQKFYAPSVAFSLFDFPKEAADSFLSGVAHIVSISFIDHDTKFHAKHFTGYVTPL